ncbi:MAG: 2-oxoacid:acceptor oxidoreductase subunit alpha, partial [Maricaulis sp.]
ELDRLTQKWKNAAAAVPAPVVIKCGKPARRAIVSVGGCDGAVREAMDRMAADGVHLDYLRVRGFPFSQEVDDFIAGYDEVFVVEQNRDAQLRTLLINETSADKTRLIPVLDYAGMAANPKFIVEGITAHLETLEQDH